MFKDWDLLFRVDDELQAAAARRGIELPAWPVKPLEPIQPDEPNETDYADEQAYQQAREMYVTAMPVYQAALVEYRAALRAYRAGVTDVAITRKEAIEQISSLEIPRPPSWDELAERMWVDRWLDTFIRSQVACRAARDEPTRDVIVQCVKDRLYYVILSNAGKWYHEGQHDRDWGGFVIRQVPRLTLRCAREANPPDGEQPRGDGGPDDGVDGGNPLRYVGQSSELRPDIQAELREMVDLVARNLSEQEQRLFQMLCFEAPRTDADMAAELGVTVSRLKSLKLRLLQKLKRMFGVTPTPKRKPKRPH